MSGLYIAFSVIIIIVLIIDYAAQFRPSDQDVPSDPINVVERRDQGDDAA